MKIESTATKIHVTVQIRRDPTMPGISVTGLENDLTNLKILVNGMLKEERIKNAEAVMDKFRTEVLKCIISFIIGL